MTSRRVSAFVFALVFLAVLALALIPAQLGIARPTVFDAIHLSCPDCGTATPVLRVDGSSGSSGKLLEITDAETPVFSVLDGGAISQGSGAAGASFIPNIVVAAPTGVGTATPAVLVNSAGGTGNVAEIRYSSTPVLRIEPDTDIQFNNGATTLNATSFDLNDTLIDQDLGTENLGVLPSVCTASITYTAAAGGTGTVCTIGASEVWFVHAVYVNVTDDFDATGDDATLNIGDGGDADGLLVLVDAELQAADTEGTGAVAGWQGFMSTDTIGAYLAQGLGFVYVGAETIDYAIDETSGETLTAGAATIYVVYTRIQ